MICGFQLRTGPSGFQECAIPLQLLGLFYCVSFRLTSVPRSGLELSFCPPSGSRRLGWRLGTSGRQNGRSLYMTEFIPVALDPTPLSSALSFLALHSPSVSPIYRSPPSLLIDGSCSSSVRTSARAACFLASPNCDDYMLLWDNLLII